MVKLPQAFKSLLLAIFIITSSIHSFSQAEIQRIAAYISKYKELAIVEMVRSGVPAAITLAQGILETAGGQSVLARDANNHFGIKCKSEWTGSTIIHDDDTKNECFRKYNSVEDSYKDHSDFLKSRPGYAFLFKLDPTDYEGWAKGLKKAGYATSNTYAQQLIKLIVENNLQEVSLAAIQRTNGENEMLAASLAMPQEDAVEIEAEENTRVVAVTTKQTPVTPKTTSTNYPLNAVFSINEAKVVFANAGTSLFALANNYNVSFKKLLDFNELDETDILNAGQLIFLQKKLRKGSKDIHIVQNNENLYQISQAEGIQLSAIMEYNNLQKGMQPAPGEKIYLKYSAPSAPKLAAASTYKSETSM